MKMFLEPAIMWKFIEPAESLISTVERRVRVQMVHKFFNARQKTIFMLCVNIVNVMKGKY